MESTDEACSRVLRRLCEIKAFVYENGRQSYPMWVFDVESCSSELARTLKSGSISLGHSGKLREEVPELRHLRQAVLRLAGICTAGGFGFSPAAVHKVLSTAVEDLEKYLGQNTG